MRRVSNFLIAVYRAFGRHHDTQAASAIAYQVLFAIVPLTGLLLAGFGFVMRDPEQQRKAIEALLEIVPLQSNAFVTQTIRAIVSQSVALTAVGVVGFIWTASGLFGGIREALNIAWEVRTPRSFVKGKLVDIGTMFALGVLLAASVAGTVAIHFLQTAGAEATGPLVVRGLMPLLTVAGYVLPILFSFASFMILYRVVPNVKHCVKDVWVGAALATLLFELGKNGFAFFVSRINHNQTAYGAIGDVMLFMLWMWVSAIILLIGAEVAAQSCRATSGPPLEAKPVSPE